MKKPTPIKTASADRFKDRKHGWIYSIPIPKLLHPDYGRIEVQLEVLRKNGKIRELLVSFRQHDLADLKDIFEIPTPQADKFTGLTSLSYVPGAASFFSGVWMLAYCAEHKAVSILSYPPDGTTSLDLQLLSTSIIVYYRTGEVAA